jgi:phosphotransferase system IIA component
MTETVSIVLLIGSISLLVLVILVLIYVRRRNHHVNKNKKNHHEAKQLQPTEVITYSSNERLDGARVSHRRNHPDRISEESIWKQKKEKENTEIYKRLETDRKNKMLQVYSPCNADVVAVHENITQASDDGYLNPGVLLAPNDDKLYAPISGVVAWNSLDDSMVKILSDDGTEVMIQCKYRDDDSASNREFYAMKVSDHVMISTGEMLCRFQSGIIKKNNKSIQIRMEISNYQTDQLVIIKRANYVSHGDKVLTLRLES